jgi:hypothetical protein
MDGLSLARICIRIVCSFILLGLGATGAVSAAKWNIWLREPFLSFHQFWQVLSGKDSNPIHEQDIAFIQVGEAGADKASFLLKAHTTAGDELIVSVPQEQILALIDQLAFGFANNSNSNGISSDVRFPFDATFVEVGLSPAVGKEIMAVTFGSGNRAQ